MPIKNFELVGKWNKSAPKYGWNKQDIGILTSEKGVAKIRRKFEKTGHIFNFYFDRCRLGRSYIQNGSCDISIVHKQLGFPSYQCDDDAINVIFTTNVADDRIPMTAWTIAHRLGHVARRESSFRNVFGYIEDELRRILCMYGEHYVWHNRPTNALCNHLGTMNSARQNRIVRSTEFAHELIAQSILCGRIKFNHLGRHVITRRRFVFGHPNHEYMYLRQDKDLNELNSEIDSFANIIHDEIQHGLHGLYDTNLIM